MPSSCQLVAFGLKQRGRRRVTHLLNLIVTQYMFFIFLLFTMEVAMTADVFLNRNWEEDFPKDPSGRFESFRNFLRSNFELCKWIGFVVVAAEGLCIFMSMILRALGPDHGNYSDSDEENVYATVPLLGNEVQQAPPYFADPLLHK